MEVTFEVKIDQLMVLLEHECEGYWSVHTLLQGRRIATLCKQPNRGHVRCQA